MLVAIPEEAAVFTRFAHDVISEGLREGTVLIESESGPFLLVITGAGMTAAAAATALTLHHPPAGVEIAAVISAGTCGGMPGRVKRGDIVAATRCVDWSADCTSVGYEWGQITDEHVRYLSDRHLLSAAIADGAVAGVFASANVFATPESVATITAGFPDAIIADMESAAIAQIAYRAGVPFLSLTCVSDMCSGDGGDEFNANVFDASEASARAVLRLCATIALANAPAEIA